MVLRASKKAQNDVSLDEPFSSESDGKQITLSDVIKDENADIFEKIEEKINREKLSEMLKELTPREREILNMRYGLTNGISMSQRDVANILGISRSYVSRIETKVISKLRAEK